MGTKFSIKTNHCKNWRNHNHRARQLIYLRPKIISRNSTLIYVQLPIFIWPRFKGGTRKAMVLSYINGEFLNTYYIIHMTYVRSYAVVNYTVNNLFYGIYWLHFLALTDPNGVKSKRSHIRCINFYPLHHDFFCNSFILWTKF